MEKVIKKELYYMEIYVKKNIAECFEKQISSKRWKNTTVNIGGVTDSYQPAEKQYKIMPEILKLCIKYKVPISVSTKSNLILRDFDLFAELATFVPVNITCTITTVNENIRKLIEPNAAPAKDRFNNLKEFSKTNVNTGIFIMPIIPELTDSYNNLSMLYKTAKENNVNIIPIDSEHSAILQCMQTQDNKLAQRLWITASGGPFLNNTREEMENFNAKDALNHPRWAMGKKITID